MPALLSFSNYGLGLNQDRRRPGQAALGSPLLPQIAVIPCGRIVKDTGTGRAVLSSSLGNYLLYTCCVLANMS
jgi:hypothetical protein